MASLFTALWQMRPGLINRQETATALAVFYNQVGPAGPGPSLSRRAAPGTTVGKHSSFSCRPTLRAGLDDFRWRSAPFPDHSDQVGAGIAIDLGNTVLAADVDDHSRRGFSAKNLPQKGRLLGSDAGYHRDDRSHRPQLVARHRADFLASVRFRFTRLYGPTESEEAPRRRTRRGGASAVLVSAAAVIGHRAERSYCQKPSSQGTQV